MMSVRKFAIALSLTIAALGPVFAQGVQKLDPSLDQLIDTNVSVERVATGFNKWTEGPVWTRGGTLLFAEIPSNNIIQWIPGKGASVFLHPSGYKGSKPFTGPEPGSNGMTLDSQGRVTVAGHAGRDVWRMESLDPKAPLTILADQYQGQPLNSPNDLVYASDGSLYFTDPPYGLATQGDSDPEKKLKVNGVYRIPKARDQRAGAVPARDKLQLVISDLPRPNGIALSPDEKVLYIANSGPPKWMRYSVQPDGTVSDGKLLFDATGEKGVGGPDGIKVDRTGNLWGSGPGGVWILSPAGKHLGTIPVPERVANLAWGDEDGKMLYIVASTSVYRIRTKVGGVKP
ncbi:MAG TPA: SMP-30/gluconolactonase/LRE family protein [Bryobacteraceae bacterium]|nr:SMP-30/gluconolactonase/LRE family protein [Bryobacteraceae bacterium]